MDISRKSWHYKIYAYSMKVLGIYSFGHKEGLRWAEENLKLNQINLYLYVSRLLFSFPIIIILNILSYLFLFVSLIYFPLLTIGLINFFYFLGTISGTAILLLTLCLCILRLNEFMAGSISMIQASKSYKNIIQRYSEARAAKKLPILTLKDDI